RSRRAGARILRPADARHKNAQPPGLPETCGSLSPSATLVVCQAKFRPHLESASPQSRLRNGNTDGAWPSGKARDFGSRIRRFESFRPSQFARAAAVMGEPFMATGFGELKVFSGSAHPELTREIAAFLGVPTGQARLCRFPDTEISFQIDENIRGTDVFVVQPTCATQRGSVDQHLMELMVMVDAFR